MSDSKLVYSTGPDGPQDVAPKAAPNPGGLGRLSGASQNGRGTAGDPSGLSGTQAALPPLGQRVKVRRETAARGGKTVTALWDFQSSERQLEELAKALKKSLGVGGSAKHGRVEIQGDKVQAVMAWLEKNGYKPVKAGG